MNLILPAQTSRFRRCLKKFLIFLGIVVISLVCLALIKDQIVKLVVTREASKLIGAPVHIDGLSLSLLDSTIRISGLMIANPAGFPEGHLVFCPKMNLIYDRATIFKKNRHFHIMDIDIKEIELTHNREGQLNVDALKIMQRPKAVPPTPLQIDLLALTIGKIIHKDYTKNSEPDVRVYDVNRHDIYRDLVLARQLTRLLLAEPMKIVAIKRAGIYGEAQVAGESMLRIVGQATLVGKDSVQETIEAGFDQMHALSLEVLKRMGTITKNDAPNGAIKANINGTMVALKLRRKEDQATEITISARQFMFPKLDIAGGVLYQILHELR